MFNCYDCEKCLRNQHNNKKSNNLCENKCKSECEIKCESESNKYLLINNIKPECRNCSRCLYSIYQYFVYHDFQNYEEYNSINFLFVRNENHIKRKILRLFEMFKKYQENKFNIFDCIKNVGKVKGNSSNSDIIQLIIYIESVMNTKDYNTFNYYYDSLYVYKKCSRTELFDRLKYIMNFDEYKQILKIPKKSRNCYWVGEVKDNFKFNYYKYGNKRCKDKFRVIGYLNHMRKILKSRNIKIIYEDNDFNLLNLKKLQIIRREYYILLVKTDIFNLIEEKTMKTYILPKCINNKIINYI